MIKNYDATYAVTAHPAPAALFSTLFQNGPAGGFGFTRWRLPSVAPGRRFYWLFAH